MKFSEPKFYRIFEWLLIKTATTLLPVDQDCSMTYQIKLTDVGSCTKLQNLISKISTDQNEDLTLYHTGGRAFCRPSGFPSAAPRVINRGC